MTWSRFEKPRDVKCMTKLVQRFAVGSLGGSHTTVAEVRRTVNLLFAKHPSRGVAGNWTLLGQQPPDNDHVVSLVVQCCIMSTRMDSEDDQADLSLVDTARVRGLVR
jgi:hypothetical protein